MKVSSVQPVGEMMLIRQFEPQERNSAGIYIAAHSEKLQLVATVVAVGAGLKREDGSYAGSHFQRGDVVYISDWSGTKISLDVPPSDQKPAGELDVEHTLISEEHLLAIIKPGSDQPAV